MTGTSWFQNLPVWWITACFACAWIGQEIGDKDGWLRSTINRLRNFVIFNRIKNVENKVDFASDMGGSQSCIAIVLELDFVKAVTVDQIRITTSRHIFAEKIYQGDNYPYIWRPVIKKEYAKGDRESIVLASIPFDIHHPGCCGDQGEGRVFGASHSVLMVIDVIAGQKTASHKIIVNVSPSRVTGGLVLGTINSAPRFMAYQEGQDPFQIYPGDWKRNSNQAVSMLGHDF